MWKKERFSTELQQVQDLNTTFKRLWKFFQNFRLKDFGIRTRISKSITILHIKEMHILRITTSRCRTFQEAKNQTHEIEHAYFSKVKN